MKQPYERKQSDARKIHIAITLGVMVFIFLHSSMTGDQSGGESIFFAKFLASITGLSLQSANFIFRKAAHFTEFMVLGACLAVNFCDLRSESALSRTEQTSIRRFFETHPQISSWILGTLYACTDEFHQLFVEGRSCEFRDVCIDSAGVAAGVLIASLVNKAKAKQYSNKK